MNHLTNIDYLKNLFRQYHLKPKHYLGQNFLVDQGVLDEIIQAAQLKKIDTVLEVGSGVGTLTEELVRHAGKVIAVEKDKRFAEILKALGFPSPRWGGIKGGVKDGQVSPPPRIKCGAGSNLPHQGGGTLTLINQDILRFNLDQHIKGPYKVVANIPYYLTSHLIRRLLEQKNKPQLIVLMVQKEVGERLVASAGELSLLAISVQVFAEVEVAAQVSKNSFWPKPKVDSVIVSIKPNNKHRVEDEKLFFRMLKIAFAGKRKQLHNSLANGFHLPKEKILEFLEQARIQPTLRPQDLSVENWLSLSKVLKKQKIS